MAERSPGPLMNMSPAGLPGLMVVIGVALGMWTLFRGFFLPGLALMGIIALVAALMVRRWRARHPHDSDLLHLDPDPADRKSSDV